jgi:hypothetical protein
MLPSCLVDSVYPPLIEVNDKNNVVSEAGDAVHGGHCDDEAEQVVDNSV